MLAFGVLKALGKTKVYDVDVILGEFSSADEEVVRLNVSVNNAFFVHLLYPFDHLDGNQTDGFEVELAFALHKEVFKTRTEHVHNHYMELIFLVCLVSADIV
jgi:hypothetical protein